MVSLEKYSPSDFRNLGDRIPKKKYREYSSKAYRSVIFSMKFIISFIIISFVLAIPFFSFFTGIGTVLLIIMISGGLTAGLYINEETLDIHTWELYFEDENQEYYLKFMTTNDKTERKQICIEYLLSIGITKHEIQVGFDYTKGKNPETINH